MNRKEFTRRRDRLQEEIFNTLLAYKVYLSIWPTEEVVDVINKYKDFFQPIRISLYFKWTSGLANILDKDSRTVSIINLLNIAIKNKGELAQKSLQTEDLLPNLSDEDIIKLQEDLLDYKRTLQKIKDERNQYLAHLDSNPKPLPKKLKGEIDSLLNTISIIFNKLSSGHDGRLYSWSFQEDRSSRTTAEVLVILKDEMIRQKERADRLIQDTSVPENE